MADPEGNEFCIAGWALAHLVQWAVEAAISRSRQQWKMATRSPLDASDPRDPW